MMNQIVRERDGKYECVVCKQIFDDVNVYSHHMYLEENKVTFKNYSCPRCFLQHSVFTNHRKHVNKCLKKIKICSKCNNTSKGIYRNLCVYCSEGFTKCRYCIEVLPLTSYVKHLKECVLFKGEQFGGGFRRDITYSVNTRFNGKIESLKIMPVVNFDADFLGFMSMIQKNVNIYVKKRLIKLVNIKIYFTLKIEYAKYVDEDGVSQMRVIDHFHRVKTKKLFHESEINDIICEMIHELFEKIQNFCRMGSGWQVKRVLFLEIDSVKYQPLIGKGRAYPLPIKLKRCRYLRNILNTRDDCFVYCILSAIYGKTSKSYLRRYFHTIKLGHIKLPLAVKDVNKIESLNSFRINVFAYDKDIYPVYVSKVKEYSRTINLLLYKDHYCLITDFDKFVSSVYRVKCSKRKRYYCLSCLCNFKSIFDLRRHENMCIDNNYNQILTLPEKGQNILKFKNYRNLLPMPVVIYFDFESYLVPKDRDQSRSL